MKGGLTRCSALSSPVFLSVPSRALHINVHGGRSSVSGIVATVFGCSGFLGRNVVGKLGQIGSRVIIPYRGEEYAVRHLKLAGDISRITPMWYNPRNKETMKRAMEDSNVVINLVGSRKETNNFSFYDTNVTIPAMIASAAKEVGVERLIHVSAAGADVNSPSDFARSKALGEQVVREAFPNATIFRPCTIFGRDDRFLNRFGSMAKTWPIFPELYPNRLVQPLFVQDFVAALLTSLTKHNTIGETYYLGGPRIYSYEDVYDLVFNETYQPANRRRIPSWMMRSVASVLHTMTWRPSWVVDEVLYMQSRDDIVPATATNIVKEWQIPAAPLEKIAPLYLRAYRPADYL